MARLYANEHFPLPAVEALRIHTVLEARPQMAGQLVRVNRPGE